MIARKRVPRPYVPITTGRGVVLGLALAIILGALFWWDFPPKQYSLHAGEVSRVRISAPRAVTFDSPSKTKEAQDKAAAAIPDSYNPPDVQIGRAQLTRAQAVLNYLDALRHDPYANLDQKQQAVAQVPELSLTLAVLSATLGLDDTRWTIVSREALAALEQTMRTEIRPEQVADARRMLPRFVSRELNGEETMLAGELAQGFVLANTLPNPQMTALLRDEARHSVAPVRVTIRQDETIIREGEVITPVEIEALDALGLLETQRDIREVAGLWLFAALLAGVIAFHFGSQPARAWVEWRRVMLVIGLVAVSVLAAKLMVPQHALQPYLVPLPAVAMILALVFGAPSAILVSACLSLVVGLMSADSRTFELLVYMFGGSAVAALSVQRVERINSFARGGVLVALTQMIVIAAFVLLSQPAPQWVEFLARLAAAVVNATVSVSLALAGYSLMAQYLGIITPLQLFELARPTHPLLRQLLLKAPGTYHHTLLLANMAERAAEAIGADPLLARVAAYYHDIGKTTQPYFFIENQTDNHNPHDELNDPYESARIVINHVYDGMALAQKYRLPRQIADV
ncbi:MAG: HDIG domain-containing protein, partial [Chloroflexi bacterium]